MENIMKNLRSGVLKRVAYCNRAVAMLEFAFILPILLLMILGGLEIAQLAMAHMRVSQIAITVADNAGRTRTGIDEANIYELFSGAKLVGKSISFEDNGRIVLSSLEPNGQTDANQGQVINWQRCYGALNIPSRYGVEGDGAEDSSLADGLGKEGHEIQSAGGTAVMFAEVTYHYQPLVSGILGWGMQTLRYESAFNVRERTNQEITNVKNLSVNGC